VANRESGCLFCGNTTGRFESEEHVIPASLGNSTESGLVEAEIVVPAGEVCDKCNGRRLSRVDNALISWPPVSVFRSLGQIANRRGNLVDAVAATDWEVKLDPADPRQFELLTDARTDGASGREDVARALCKIAVEARWLADPEDARSARWDELAAAAIGGPLPAGLVLGLTQPAGMDDVDLRPAIEMGVGSDPGKLEMYCEARVVGLRLLLTLDCRPPRIPEAWWDLDPASGQLRGPDSMWGHFRGTADRAVRLTAPAPPPNPRRSIQLPTTKAGHQIQITPGKPPRKS
jgi:hypothetical protein